MDPSDFLPSAAAPGRVLAVDDNAFNHRLLAAQLKPHPFVVTYADGPTEALALCGAQTFEAILSDVTMPGMDGLEFSRRLRGTRNGRTPLIFLSAVRADDASVSAWMESGAIDYLPKPCPPAELAAKLRMMVRISRQQAALIDGERQAALLAIAGGAAHELSQPLAGARLLLDRLERRHEPPTPEQMSQLRDFVDRTASILDQIRGLRVYVTKSYAAGASILDLEKSREISGAHEAHKPSKPAGKE